MLEWVNGEEKTGYAAFDSSSGWMTRPAYLRCEVIDLPIAYSEQVRQKLVMECKFVWRIKKSSTFIKKCIKIS